MEREAWIGECKAGRRRLQMKTKMKKVYLASRK